jgi:hypothetical protein
MKVALPTKMKCAVVSAFVSLTFLSPASAVLRPLFPIKPAAPTNGEIIVLGDELVLRTAKKRAVLALPAFSQTHPSAETRHEIETPQQ